MNNGFTALLRTVALSVAITVVATPAVSAQAPEPTPSIAAPNRPLLSPAAFARLIQPEQSDETPQPVVKSDSPPSLFSQSTAAMARLSQTGPAKAPQQKSWASRHKVALGVLIGAAAFTGIFFAWCGPYCFE